MISIVKQGFGKTALVTAYLGMVGAGFTLSLAGALAIFAG